MCENKDEIVYNVQCTMCAKIIVIDHFVTK